MKILYHHRTQAEDGQAVHIRSLIAAFEALGHEVLEAGLVKHGKEPRPVGTGGSSKWGWVTRTPRFVRELAEYGYNAVARKNLLREAVHFEPDLIYERYAFANAAGIMAARRLRRPLILEVNSPMVLELEKTRGLSFPRMADRVERFVFGSADRVCTVTGVLRDMLVEMGVERERVFVTPNGVHLEQFDYADPVAARAAGREALGLAAPLEGELVLGFVGYYRDWHRLDVVLECLTEPELRAARLVLVGEGPAREGLEEKARTLGVTDRLHFAGRRPHAEIPRLLPAFDVALVPAINPYASPLKLHEYMAAGVASVAPDQPNLREVLTDGVDALLVPPGDGEALVAALARLATDVDLRRSLGARARRTITERDLTWSGNARRVLAQVSELRAEQGAQHA